MLQVWKIFSPLTKVGMPERSYGAIDYCEDKTRRARNDSGEGKVTQSERPKMTNGY